jgi:chemotaxis protein methyltransferase CheR
MTERINISDEELRALTHAIKTRYGLDFTEYETKSLKRGFARLMMKRKITSLLDMWRQVMRDREFIFSCIDDLTVNLTELFRNPEFWIYMHQTLLPEFAYKQLNIWHAGCSTGEEVYSMRITADLSNMLVPNQTATDLSQRVLDKAADGNFVNMLLKKYQGKFETTFPNKKFVNYFDLDEDHFSIKSIHKRKINFFRHNLIHDAVKDTYDIIFCRNVLIYFDDALKLKVLELFYKSLVPGGYLIMGYYDVMPTGSEKYFTTHHHRCRVYKMTNDENKSNHTKDQHHTNDQRHAQPYATA